MRLWDSQRSVFIWRWADKLMHDGSTSQHTNNPSRVAEWKPPHSNTVRPLLLCLLYTMRNDNPSLHTDKQTCLPELKTITDDSQQSKERKTLLLPSNTHINTLLQTLQSKCIKDFLIWEKFWPNKIKPTLCQTLTVTHSFSCQKITDKCRTDCVTAQVG